MRNLNVLATTSSNPRPITTAIQRVYISYHVKYNDKKNKIILEKEKKKKNILIYSNKKKKITLSNLIIYSPVTLRSDIVDNSVFYFPPFFLSVIIKVYLFLFFFFKLTDTIKNRNSFSMYLLVPQQFTIHRT